MAANRSFVSVNIPFPGFYESDLSWQLDNAEEMMTGDDSNESGEEAKHAEEVQLDASERQECLFHAMDYGAAHLHMARDYVKAFDSVAGEILDLTKSGFRHRWTSEAALTLTVEPYKQPSLHIAFEEMTSPREYNFTTDRLFVQMPAAIMWRLFKRSASEGHATLADVIRARFTSYDGFCSFYSNQLSAWLEKPLSDWDHNELGTLLIAAMKLAEPDYQDTLRDDIGEALNESAYNAIDSACDWTKYEQLKAEKRAEKAEGSAGA